ncbi:MAG: hypothetical protein WBA37_15420 [Xanthobacteraceae bacterium]
MTIDDKLAKAERRENYLCSRGSDATMAIVFVGVALATMSPIFRGLSEFIGWTAFMAGVCSLAYGVFVIKAAENEFQDDESHPTNDLFGRCFFWFQVFCCAIAVAGILSWIIFTYALGRPLASFF